MLEPEAIDRIPIDSFGGSIDLQESNLNIRQIWALETAFYSDDHWNASLAIFELPHKRPRNCTQSLSSAFNDVFIGRSVGKRLQGWWNCGGEEDRSTRPMMWTVWWFRMTIHRRLERPFDEIRKAIQRKDFERILKANWCGFNEEEELVCRLTIGEEEREKRQLICIIMHLNNYSKKAIKKSKNLFKTIKVLSTVSALAMAFCADLDSNIDFVNYESWLAIWSSPSEPLASYWINVRT